MGKLTPLPPPRNARESMQQIRILHARNLDVTFWSGFVWGGTVSSFFVMLILLLVKFF